MEWLIALGVAVVCFVWGFGLGKEATTRAVARMLCAGLLRWTTEAERAERNRTEIAP